MDNKWNSLHDQCVRHLGAGWSVARLVDASKILDVFDMPIVGPTALSTFYDAPCANTMADFIYHMDKCDNADLKYPIIMHPDGTILDGKHRLIKALRLGNKTMKAVRFTADNLPKPDVIDD